MKNNKIALSLIVFGLMTSAITANLVWAHDGHEDAHMHDDAKSMKEMHTTQDLLKMIEQEHQLLIKTVAGKNLSEVHEHAFTIRDLSKELSDEVVVEKKMKVASTASNISKLSDELDKSGDAGNQAATEANLKKMDGLLKMLYTQVL